MEKNNLYGQWGQWSLTADFLTHRYAYPSPDINVFPCKLQEIGETPSKWSKMVMVLDQKVI